VGIILWSGLEQHHSSLSILNVNVTDIFALNSV